MNLQITGQTQDQVQKSARPIVVWLIAIATWIALCVFTSRIGKTDPTQVLFNFLFANFASMPGLLFTTLSRHRKSAFRRWQAVTVFVQIPGLPLWIAHAFEPTLTGGTAGPMAGFSVLPMMVIVYILGSFGLFFLVAIPDVIGQSKPD